MRVFALLNIPERCALVGGQIVIRSLPYLGSSTGMKLVTEYREIWEKTVEIGKTYFIPMIIAPQGGDTLWLMVDTEAIGPDVRSAKSEVQTILPSPQPKILFSGRLMVPGEEFYDWRKIQVNPAEITFPEVEK